MQKVSCFLRLGGDMQNTVPKKCISVAEVAILQHLHGNDAVTDIRRISNKNGESHAAEIERLRRTYTDKAFAEVFPGRVTSLPVYLKDIGIEDDSPFLAENVRAASIAVEDDDDQDDDNKAKKGRGRPKKATGSDEKSGPKETAAKDFVPTIQPEGEAVQAV